MFFRPKAPLQVTKGCSCTTGTDGVSAEGFTSKASEIIHLVSYFALIFSIRFVCTVNILYSVIALDTKTNSYCKVLLLYHQ